jgi:hypothetical protein
VDNVFFVVDIHHLGLGIAGNFDCWTLVDGARSRLHWMHPAFLRSYPGSRLWREPPSVALLVCDTGTGKPAVLRVRVPRVRVWYLDFQYREYRNPYP